MQGGEEKKGEARERVLEKGKGVAEDDGQQSGRANDHPYPKAMAKYEEVLADPKLFRDTLEKLHCEMGTRYMVPIIGGRYLDLHRLFVEVTSRGGIEKLIAEKRWREVTAVFNFPSTATNASFILRKYYMSLLHDYEQIYFSGSQGRNSPAPSNTLSLNPVPSDRLVAPVMPSYESQIALLMRGRSNAPSNTLSMNPGPSNRLFSPVIPSYEPQIALLNRGRNNAPSSTLAMNSGPSNRLFSPVTPSYLSQIPLLNRERNNASSNTFTMNSGPSNRLFSPVTPSYISQIPLLNRGRNNGQSSTAHTQVVGVIDGRFEHGYFVTVTVGSAKLRGVLYHTPERTAVHVPQYSAIGDDNNHGGSRHQKSMRLSTIIPSYPKPNMSGYNFFFAEQHARLEPNYPGKDREISKMVGELWNKLTENEKAVYQERGLRDKERYQSEMKIYRERLNGGQIISNAVPIQQCPREQAMNNASTRPPIIDLTLTSDSSSADDEDDDTEDKISHEDSEVDTALVMGRNGA